MHVLYIAKRAGLCERPDSSSEGMFARDDPGLCDW